MANGNGNEPTRKNFDDLIKAQRETNKLLQEQLVDFDRGPEFRTSAKNAAAEIASEIIGQRRAAKRGKESHETEVKQEKELENIEKLEQQQVDLAKEGSKKLDKMMNLTSEGHQDTKDTNDDTEKTHSLLSRLMKNINLALAASPYGSHGSRKKEKEQKDKAKGKKELGLLTKMAKGIDSLGSWTDKQMKKLGGGLWAFVKGTLFAGFLAFVIWFFNSDKWPEIQEKLVKFIQSLEDGLQFQDIADAFDIEVENLKTAFRAIKAVLGALVARLALGWLLGGPIAWVLVGTAAAAYFFFPQIKAGFCKLREVFESIFPNLEEWQKDLAATVTLMGGFFGIFAIAKRLLRKIPGLGGGAAKAAATGAAIHAGGAAADVAARKWDAKSVNAMLKQNQVMALKSGEKVIWQGNQFSRYVGDVKHGGIHKGPLTAETGLRGNISTAEVQKAGLKNINKGALGRLMKLGRTIPTFSLVLSAILAKDILTKHGLTKAAVPELGGIFGGTVAAVAGAGLGSLLGPAGTFLGGLVGFLGGEKVGKAIAQWIVGEKVTALTVFGSNFLNDQINALISGKSGRGTSMPMGGMFEGGGADAMMAAADVMGLGSTGDNAVRNIYNPYGPLTNIKRTTPDPLGLTQFDQRMMGADPFGLRDTLATPYRWKPSNIWEEVFGPMKYDDDMVSGIMSGGKIDLIEPIKMGNKSAIPVVELGQESFDAKYPSIAKFMNEWALEKSGMSFEGGNGETSIVSAPTANTANTTNYTSTSEVIPNDHMSGSILSWR